MSFEPREERAFADKLQQKADVNQKILQDVETFMAHLP